MRGPRVSQRKGEGMGWGSGGTPALRDPWLAKPLQGVWSCYVHPLQHHPALTGSLQLEVPLQHQLFLMGCLRLDAPPPPQHCPSLTGSLEL